MRMKRRVKTWIKRCKYNYYMASQRQSNIELLRNISMFLILVIHANFVSLPKIGYVELASNAVPSIFRFFIESIGIAAVNVFVFISGWFGIIPKKKSVLSFIYLILFYLLGGGILFFLLGKAPLGVDAVLDIFQLSRNDWFIKSYFVLMIIAPILNTFSKNADEKTQRYVVIAFFLFEAIYGWAAGGRRFFVNGYGPLHFIGLYITAQYVHNQIASNSTPVWLKRLVQMPKWVDMMVFLLMAIANTIIVVVGLTYLKTDSLRGVVFAYSNPLMIIEAIYLMLFFNKLKMPYVKVINWLGASSFAVYLFHGQATIRAEFFNPQIQYLYETYSGLICVMLIFLFLCFVYLVSVIIDQLRIISWNLIWNISNKKSTLVER